MKDFPHSDIPDEKQIEELLSNFRPQPTARFVRKLQRAPWQKRTTWISKSPFHSMIPARKWIWIIAAALLVLVLLGASFIPSVQAVARQIINNFISAPTNQLEIQVTLSRPGDLLLFSEAGDFPLSINEAQQQAGFTVRAIGRLPEDLAFIGSRYEPGYGAVIVLYQANDYKLFLTQRPLGIGQDIFSIGSSAQVKLVNIGDSQGEYVEGGWKAVATQLSPDNVTPDTPIMIRAIWEDNLPQYTLRWQTSGYIYEIRSFGEGSPTESELITLAYELK